MGKENPPLSREARLAAIVERNKKAARSRAKMKAARQKHKASTQE